MDNPLLYFLLKILFIYFQREGKGGREGEKHQCVVASRAPSVGDMARNPGMCPDWESNWQSFDSQAGTQSTESPQPGLHYLISRLISIFIHVIQVLIV